MNQDIIQKLKRLKSVKPEKEFILKSRRLVLAVPQKRPIFAFSWIWAGVLAAVFLLVAVSAISTNSLLRNGYATLINPEDISQEFDNLTINIQLRQISYQQNVNSAIASALNEISDSGPRHLKTSLLEKELDTLDINGGLDKQKQINELLDKVIF